MVSIIGMLVVGAGTFYAGRMVSRALGRTVGSINSRAGNFGGEQSFDKFKEYSPGGFMTQMNLMEARDILGLRQVTSTKLENSGEKDG